MGTLQLRLAAARTEARNPRLLKSVYLYFVAFLLLVFIVFMSSANSMHPVSLTARVVNLFSGS